jgi:hypothetical protein
MRVSIAFRAVALLGLVVAGCSAKDELTPADEPCVATPVAPALVTRPDPNENSYDCPTDWYKYDDTACGFPPSSGCTRFGDGRCYKPCETDADCCDLRCDTIPIYNGSDASSMRVHLCREPPAD